MVVIVEAEEDDIPQIAKLMKKEFRKPPFNAKCSLSQINNFLDYYYKNGSIFVAKLEKEVVGIMVFKIEQYWEGPALILEELAVKEKYRKLGIGKQLLTTLEEYAKNNKLFSISLRTNKVSSAVKFYKKCGYEPKDSILYIEKKLAYS